MTPAINRNNYWSPESRFRSGLTPFGYYDTDPDFIVDADRFALYSAKKIGYAGMTVELDAGSFYTALEEAIMAYSNEINNFKLRDQYSSLLGVVSSSIDISSALTVPTLSTAIRMAKEYGSEAGVGGRITYYTGSILTVPGQQDYDLNAWAITSASIVTGDTIEIKRVFHQRIPALMRYFDPTNFSGIGMSSFLDGFGLGGFSPAVNFMILPLNLDVLRIQSIELNDEIRRSHYSFELVNNQLRLFPVPGEEMPVWFHYIKESERNSPAVTVPQGAITNQSQVPYQNLTYKAINSSGRYWIFQWAHTVALYMLANIRGKYQQIPYAQGAQTLNSADLRAEADRNREDLLTQLRELLEATSSRSQLERQSEQADFLRNTLSNVALPIIIG